MSSVNSLNGKPIKDGKIIYSEKLQNGLNFVVIVKYQPFYDGKNSGNYQESTNLSIETLITNGNVQNSSNGITYLLPSEINEIADEKGKFPKMHPDFNTKDGYRVFQKDYYYQEHNKEVGNKKWKEKTRNVIWLVEVPKKELIKYIK